MSGPERILVMKFSALGDFAQCFGAFQTIRKAHPGAEITLLTTPPYQGLARDSGLFDRVEIDAKPKGAQATLALIWRLRMAGYRRVYDIQTSGRSSRYRLFFFPWFPEWSGIAAGASHRQTRPDRQKLHNMDRLADQMHVAGIAPAYPIGAAPTPDLSTLARVSRGEHASTAERFGVRPPFALLIPGASAGRTDKHWPIEFYQCLARTLTERGLSIVVAGSPQEAPLGRAIAEAAPATVDLTGKTSMTDLAGLGAEAALCVTNDTGPGHMAAYAGAPGLMLMSHGSFPEHCSPRAAMRTVFVDDLAALTPEAVLEALGDLVCLGSTPPAC